MSVRCICNICGRGMIPMRPDKEGVLRRIVSGKYEFHEFVCPATPEQHSVQALAGELKRVREALDAYGPDVEDLAERAAAFRREANRADEATAQQFVARIEREAVEKAMEEADKAFLSMIEDVDRLRYSIGNDLLDENYSASHMTMTAHKAALAREAERQKGEEEL